MERMLSSNKETESIYEIYRACRLCGGGAGYKMPIIQNIVDLDESDVELKQKIRECVQIEVHQDDKMPPLICELCVDKVNDFYEFLDMCRQTNKRTRLRLGLPPQSLPKGAPDAGDCILGVTEPLFANEDSDGEPLSKHKKTSKVKIKKEPQSQKVKEENRKLRHRNSDEHEHSSNKKCEPRITRNRSKDDDVSLSSLKDKASTLKATPKSILKKDSSKADDSISLKRLRDKEVNKSETPSKKVKLSTPPKQLSPKLQQKPSSRFKPKPKSLKSTDNVPKKSASPVQEIYPCDICGFTCKTIQARTSHWKSHTVGFTNSKLACNPCGDWFPTPEDLATHQKRHKSRNIPYNCRICDTEFKKMADYESHFEDNECIPCKEVPDVKCDICWNLFPTNNLLDKHKCLGKDNRPGGKCYKCNKSYSLLKNLKKHESSCTSKKKGYSYISKELLNQLKPIQIRVARCDPLLANVKQEHYDVSCVSDEYGLDENCYYPYQSRFRTSNFQGMVKINDDIKKAFCAEDYVHWDSDESDSDQEITCNDALNPGNKKKKVPSLAAIALKKLFSNRLLGKVPKKKRKIKPEKVFDSILNDQDEVRMDISSLIDNLGDDDDIYNDNNDSNIAKVNSDLKNNVSGDDTDVESYNDNDRIKCSVINNYVNDRHKDKKTDDVSSIDDSSKDAVDFNINNDNAIKDNSSVDSIDILQDLKNSAKETENAEINDNYDNDSVEKGETENLRLETDSVDSNTKINDNHSVDSKLSNNNSNNDSDLVSNNDSIDTAVLEEEISKQSNETSNGINDSVENQVDKKNNLSNDNDNSSNDKVINEIDKLLNNSTEKVSYNNINDLSFDT